jgi:6-phosphogluconolactonase
LRIETLPDGQAVARYAAHFVAGAARYAVAARGRFVLAVSGGSTPWRMLSLLAHEDVPWPRVHMFQVDERVAPEGHRDRNLTHLRASLLVAPAAAAMTIHAMRVDEPDLTRAAELYAALLRTVAGVPPVLDLVHLGLGADGHTASLFDDDHTVGETDADVAVTRSYHGRRRLTLTYPVFERARSLLWLVTGSEKGAALAAILGGDRTVPAGRVGRDHALLVCDAAAFTAARAS